MPPQKLPKESQGCPASSSTRWGSMAFQSSAREELSTFPSSFHAYFSLDGSSVRFVASPMAERLLPKVPEDVAAQPPADEVFGATDADARPRREEVEASGRFDDGRVVDVAHVAR